MRGKKSKEIRERVFNELGYEPTVDDPKRKIIDDPDFKSVNRAARKNYQNGKRLQFPKIKISNRQKRQQVCNTPQS